MSMVMYGHDVHTLEDRDHGLFHLVGKRPAEQKADGSTIFGAATYPVDTTLNGAQIQAMVDERLMRYSATASSGDYVWIEITVRDADGPPRIRSELGGLMGPGYQATGYEPPPRRQVLLDDPTGDDIAGDVK